MTTPTQDEIAALVNRAAEWWLYDHARLIEQMAPALTALQARVAERDAMVGAAYEAAASVSDTIASGKLVSEVTQNGRPVRRISPAMHHHAVTTAAMYVSDSIRALTPASATAAHTAAIRAAHVAGMKEAGEIAYEAAHNTDDISKIRDAILTAATAKERVNV